ncbi:VOC family protein [Anatilimnocola sp. NA78]|uniref:VOC family protein n=1 Tax=Anatilimnocola sp. NA78 TaxID=3415683 RepID=UPI003CE4BB4B
MATKIFVNLPVKDLPRSIKFFEGLGYSFNPQFTDETASCMIIGEDIFAMLLTHAKFKEFTPKEICDSTKATEVLVALSCDSREAVDKIADKAIAGGGSNSKDPMDLGFMYSRSIQDLDGHIWEYVWMDPSAIPS